MNTCSICGKEHDGSYGSGKFCSKHCRYVYIGKQTKNHVCNFPKRKGKGNWKCPHCGKIFESKLKLIEHKKSFHKDYPTWNKGLTKETSNIVAKSSNTLKQKFENGELVSSFKGKHHSNESIQKMMKTYSKNYKNMKYRGFYHGFYFEYSYELAFIVYNLEHKIFFKRCEKSFEYISSKDNKKHLYFPDFELEDGTIIEIKGRINEIVFEKLNAVKKLGNKIILLTKFELTPHIQYCIEKYGKKYLEKLKNT